MKIINGNEFAKISHFYIDEDLNNCKPAGGLTIDILSQDAIIYCKTDYLAELFNLIKFSSRRYILITHDSDYSINHAKFHTKPACIEKWFGKNVTIDHPDLINIPIGVENEIRREGGPLPKVDYPWFYENMENLSKKPKRDNVVYCNWNPATNPTRYHIIENLEKNNISIEFEKEKLSHKDYCHKLSDYQYVLCPPGNGVSTHRFWETLYLGSIPIVLNHRIYRDYTLPFIKLNRWEDLTNDILAKFDKNSYSYEMLDMEYWAELIKKSL